MDRRDEATCLFLIGVVALAFGLLVLAMVQSIPAMGEMTMEENGLFFVPVGGMFFRYVLMVLSLAIILLGGITTVGGAVEYVRLLWKKR